MSTKADGGPAFPRPASESKFEPDLGFDPQQGMSLRDYFAAAALGAIVKANIEMAHESGGEEYRTNDETCAFAFQLADSMLKVRRQ